MPIQGKSVANKRKSVKYKRKSAMFMENPLKRKENRRLSKKIH